VDKDGRKIRDVPVPVTANGSKRHVIYISQIGEAWCISPQRKEGEKRSFICDWPGEHVFEKPIYQSPASDEDDDLFGDRLAVAADLDFGRICEREKKGSDKITCYDFNEKKEKIEQLAKTEYHLTRRLARLFVISTRRFVSLDNGAPWYCADEGTYERCQSPGPNPHMVHILHKPRVEAPKESVKPAKASKPAVKQSRPSRRTVSILSPRVYGPAKFYNFYK
jgi:hypothetical protein